MQNDIYDIAIIGGGPAGLTAAIYGARSGRTTILFEGNEVGGQLNLIDKLENYPGIIEIKGSSLADIMLRQAIKYNVTVIRHYVSSILDGEIKSVFVGTKEYKAKNLILAMGITRKQMGFEESYRGRGVSYCATCDGNFYKGKEVMVTGNGFTAVEDALYLSNLCPKVYLLSSKMSAETSERLKGNNKIVHLPHHVVTALNGNDILESAKVLNIKDKTQTVIPVNGLFIAMGSQPLDEIVEGLKTKDRRFIITNDYRTNIKGIYAAGDICDNKLKQVITACSDGANTITAIIEDEKN